MSEWLEVWVNELNNGQNIYRDSELKILLIIIDQHLSNPKLTVEMLAGLLEMSRRQLYRNSERLLDIPPGKLIKEARLRKARWLIRKGRCKTTGQVLNEIGLGTARYFEQEFKNRFEVYPENLLTQNNQLAQVQAL
ncbi:helix-turn-helix domain-containing protein [Gracilimonas mengyeensis]|nr:helix-turn-helix domain-containing protein [Gracilimonas mengyeensis]